MDRYVLVVIINLEPKKEGSFNGKRTPYINNFQKFGFGCLLLFWRVTLTLLVLITGVDETKQVFDNLKNISNSNLTCIPPFPGKLGLFTITLFVSQFSISFGVKFDFVLV